MKKLFASMLAATMVAGMSVSAFAYVNKDGVASKTPALANTDLGIGTEGYDFAIDADTALKSDGTPITEELNGGDKVYYPIVVSGEQLELDGEVATDYYYATKSSEVEDLSVKIDVDAGSKYVDSVSIVKEDLNLGSTAANAGKKAKFSVDLAGSSVAAATTGADDNGTLKLTIGGVSVETAEYDMVNNALADGNAVAAKLAEGTSTVTGGYSVSATGSVLTFEADAVGVGTITAADSASIAIGDTVTTPGAIAQATTDTATVIEAGEAATPGTSSIGKVYCVEVKMADYFGDEAKEVEFNLSLKNNGRIVFETEDDATSFAGEFELGTDSEPLKATEYKKFRNNELTLEIDGNTGITTLDEAYLADGTTKEDVEYIYLEGKDANFTFDVKASGQDPLYLELNQDAVKEIAVANGKADLTFFNFPGEPEFDFSGTAKFGVEDEDQEYYIYEIVDGELVESSAKYNEEDGVFELRTNTLGSYVISDRELDTTVIDETDETDTEDKEDVETGGDVTTDGGSETDGDKENANTGAADLIGVASALAVVSVAAAGAVALKK